MNPKFKQWLELQVYLPVIKSFATNPYWRVIDGEYNMMSNYNWTEVNEPDF